MQATIVIPVWNGVGVIDECLAAVYAHSGDQLLEVICVDNASADRSAALIAERYPHVRLIQQPVNLGFAGGVNAGLDAARGDVIILLNQDCLVQPDWLAALLAALIDYPEFGIAGCTVFNADDTLNHTGAYIRHPDAYGIHMTEIGDAQPRRVDYVTGAAFAIRRETWQAVGRFDESFFPAYYEECDYCYRARRIGIETGYVPAARIKHLFSSREWQTDSIRHFANQYYSRYRFVVKHFTEHELAEFVEFEVASADQESSLLHAIGRTLAAQTTLRGLNDILERRRTDLQDEVGLTQRRLLQTGLAQILQRSFLSAKRLTRLASAGSLTEWSGSAAVMTGDSSAEWQAAQSRSQELKQREYDLLTRIYFRRPADQSAESKLKRWYRWLVLRPLSFISGREHLLLAELNAVHVARLDQQEQVAHLREQAAHLQEQAAQLQFQQLQHRLDLLDVLLGYEYR
jgi:GT2 family glycosyltransferase